MCIMTFSRLPQRHPLLHFSQRATHQVLQVSMCTTTLLNVNVALISVWPLLEAPWYRHYTLTPEQWCWFSQPTPWRMAARLGKDEWLIGGWEGGKEEERARVDEVMLLSCLFLIGLSRDGDHKNSFVDGGGGWRERRCVRVCAHTCNGWCVCVCVV